MGYEVFVGWGEETTWGTPVARTLFSRTYGDMKIKHLNPSSPNAWLASRDAEVPIYVSPQKGEMTMPIPLVYAGDEKLIEHMMGARRTTTGAGPYVHTYNIDDAPYTRSTSPLIGLTMEAHLALPDASLGSMLLYGGRCKSFGGTIAAGEEDKLLTEWVGQRVVQAAKTASPTFPAYGSVASSPLVRPVQTVITMGPTGSPTTQSIYGVEWNVNNNLRDDKHELGSAYISAPRAQGKREITGTLRKEWLSKTLYDAFVASPGTAYAIVATSTGPGNFVLVRRWNNVRFTGETPDPREGEETDQVLPFTAYDDSTYGAFQIVITNDTAAP